MHREFQTVTTQSIDCARGELTDRMAALERRVVGTVADAAGTVQGAAAAVRSTVDTAKTEVQRALGATADSVRSVLDVPTHVRRRPWAGLGAATVVGFLAGFIPNRTRGGNSLASTLSSNSTGVMNELWTVMRRELVSLGESAIVTASLAAKQGISSSVGTSYATAGAHHVNGRC